MRASSWLEMGEGADKKRCQLGEERCFSALALALALGTRQERNEEMTGEVE